MPEIMTRERYGLLLSRELNATQATVRGYPAENGGSARINMRGVFAGDGFTGYRGAITVSGFEGALTEAEVTKGDPLYLVVDSVGGSVATSQWLMHELRDYDTTVEARARLYSAATHMAMGANQIVAAEGSDFLLHFPWTIAVGGAAQFRQYADELDDTGNSLVQQYMKKVNLTEDDLRALMGEDRIISAARALEIGFVDEIIEATSDDAEARRKAQNMKQKVEPLPLPDGVRDAVRRAHNRPR